MQRLYNTGTLFAHQNSLQKLPVPPLKETCDRFLETIKPLAQSTEELENTRRCISEFIGPGGLGPILHARLEDRSKKLDDGWLAAWWQEYAYMGYRDPVVVFVNYFFAFADDPKRMHPSTRAASIITAAMQFRDLVVRYFSFISGTLEPEKTRAGPLCSEQYKFLFNSTRIPQKPLDITRTSNPEDNNHIIVIRKNQFFKVTLKKPNGKRMNMAEIKKFQNLTRQLDHIYSVAVSSEFPIGSLTTEQRDVWTEVRLELLQISKRNQQSFNDIETAAFVVCLDEDKPISKEEHSVSCWHGDGQNRFFDKSMQFIINDNGKAGFNGEHSMMEATVTHRACDWICSELSKGTVDLGDDSVEIIPLPQKLEFDLNSKVALAINSAIRNFEQLTSKRELFVTTFEGYGKNSIKGFGVSPDAYAQMAIQLAYYKMYQKPCATYESSGTRKFLKGRTETGRSCSVESLKWTKAMVDSSVSAVDRGKLGREAIKAQSAYMANCSEGLGVDRLFLGLKKLLKPGENPAIFKDPLFARSCHWNLSTSQVTSEFYDGYGWGEVVPDGYGIAYMVKNDSLQFNIVSQKLNNRHLDTYLHEALNEMKVVFAATNPIKAKL